MLFAIFLCETLFYIKSVTLRSKLLLMCNLYKPMRIKFKWAEQMVM